MVTKTRSALRASISGDLPNNAAALISAADVRENLIDVVDSCGNIVSGSLDIVSSGDAIGGTGQSPLLWTPILIKAAIDQLGTAPTGDQLQNLIEDTTPQLGGNLDTNSFCIVSPGSTDLCIHPGTSGAIGPTGTDGLGADSTNFQRKFSSSAFTALGPYGVLGGGANNSILITSNHGVIVGGTGNQVDQNSSSVVGGEHNRVHQLYGFIGGGTGNQAYSNSNVVVGGEDNKAGVLGQTTADAHAFVGGGSGNSASEFLAFIGGGRSNQSVGNASVVVGGWNNQAQGNYAFVGGGSGNISNNPFTVIGGGQNNLDTGDRSFGFIGGGLSNSIDGHKAVIGGGENNRITDNSDYGTIGGGTGHHIGVATTTFGTIGGGQNNIVSGDFGSILGGRSNVAGAIDTTVIGVSGTALKARSTQIGQGTNSVRDTVQLGKHFNFSSESGLHPSPSNGSIWLQNDRVTVRSRSKDWRPRGKIVFLKDMPPTINNAANVPATGAAPVTPFVIPARKFVDGITTSMDYLTLLDENYGSGGLTVTVIWTPVGAPDVPNKSCVWVVGIRSLGNGKDLDTVFSPDFPEFSGTASSSNEIVYSTLNIPQGTGLDGWSANEYGILRVGRIGADTNDNIGVDVKLLGIIGLETL